MIFYIYSFMYYEHTCYVQLLYVPMYALTNKTSLSLFIIIIITIYSFISFCFGGPAPPPQTRRLINFVSRRDFFLRETSCRLLHRSTFAIASHRTMCASVSSIGNA